MRNTWTRLRGGERECCQSQWGAVRREGVDGDNSKPNLGVSTNLLGIFGSDLKNNLIALFEKNKEGRAAVSGRNFASY